MARHSRISEPGHERAAQIARAVCVFLGLLFLAAGTLKAIDAPAFREIVGSLVKFAWPGDDGLPHLIRNPGVNIMTTLVITWEAVIGVMMLTPHTARLGLKLSTATLLIFVTVLGGLLFMPDPPSCGCLGGAGTSSSNATLDASVGIVRNLALVFLAYWSLENLPTHRKPDHNTVAEDLRCA